MQADSFAVATFGGRLNKNNSYKDIKVYLTPDHGITNFSGVERRRREPPVFPDLPVTMYGQSMVLFRERHIYAIGGKESGSKPLGRILTD